MGYSESHAENDSYKYYFLSDRNNGHGISDASDTLGAITEETDDSIDDKEKADIQHEDLSVAATAGESEIQNDDEEVSMEVGIQAQSVQSFSLL